MSQSALDIRPPNTPSDQPKPRNGGMYPRYSSLFLIFLLLSFSLFKGTRGARPARPCPYCDSSVFDYCSDKLLHDACCCLDPFEHQLPVECKLADCSFLHANSCRDHHLITRCCCKRIIKF